jgi:hypothetical protein
MNTDQVHLERRASQRFEFHLPLTVAVAGTEQQGQGFTQNLSGRGTLFYTDFPVALGDSVELKLVMPSEITLAENMRVCCKGTVVRVAPPVGGMKSEVAVQIARYEFLPEIGELEAVRLGRMTALHEHKEDTANERVTERPVSVT